MAPVSLLAWRSFKLPRKIAGSNNNETQSVAFGDEMLWLTRLTWAELHGAQLIRWRLDEAVNMIRGLLITDSRRIFDAITRSEGPQLGMRSLRSGEEARGIKGQIIRTETSFRWVNGLAMLADSLTKPGYPARHGTEQFLRDQVWKCTFDSMFESGRRRVRNGKGAFDDEVVESPEISDPLTALLDDQFLGEGTARLLLEKDHVRLRGPSGHGEQHPCMSLMS